jgi:hypothetical protein
MAILCSVCSRKSREQCLRCGKEEIDRIVSTPIRVPVVGVYFLDGL